MIDYKDTLSKQKLLFCRVEQMHLIWNMAISDVSKKLDRRRLSDAYHRFSVVMFYLRHCGDSNFVVQNDIDLEIEQSISNI